MSQSCEFELEPVMELHFLHQDLENQALAETETWREQQLQLQEQHALQNRAKQEVEAEVERHKQVRGDAMSQKGSVRKFQTAVGCVLPSF